ncbi:MAG: hypothetical protein ACYSUX_17460, partial [Planctomycetota bacterium]
MNKREERVAEARSRVSWLLLMVEAYRELRPKATWKEMYENIPNHYASVSSFRNRLARTEWKQTARRNLAKRKV